MAIDIKQLQAAARDISRHIKPVLEVEEGSRGYRQIGSASLLRFADKWALVTAHHVVAGPTTKKVVMTPKEVIEWPKAYLTTRPRSAAIPEADVAYARGNLVGAKDDAVMGIPTEQLAPRFDPETDPDPGASFMAIGYPRSRAKVRLGEGNLRNQVHYAVATAERVSEYASLGLDPRVHVALRYNRKEGRSIDGATKEGVDPHGMSGGLMCLPLERRTGGTSQVMVVVVGVLTAYHPPPHNLLVATRIDCLLDALAPFRPVDERTHDEQFP